MKAVQIKLSSVTLGELAKIQKRREELLAELDSLNQESERLGLRVPGIRARRPRNSIRGAIITVLKEAGGPGLTVQEIVEASGLTRDDVDKWLYSKSARETPGFRKIGPARYGIRGSGKRGRKV
jgi:hypothetical protein